MSAMQSDAEVFLANLRASQEIQQLSIKYARAQDRLDAMEHRSVFCDDAVLRYARFEGGPDDFVSFAQGALRKMRGSYHQLGQMDIRLEEGWATGEIHCLAWHRLLHEGREMDLFVGCIYHDSYVFNGDQWLISCREEEVVFSNLSPSDASFYQASPSNHG